MFLLGFLLYSIVILGSLFFGPLTDIVKELILLAPEITFLITVIYLYPLGIALFHVVRKRSDAKDFKFLSKQTTLAASLTVSIGLIGTFLGLTDMISAIAESTTGSDDISEQMSQLMGSISVALSAMSYAFLTSILGVAISVLLLTSLNFWEFRYAKDKKKEYPKDKLAELNEKIDELSNVSVSLHDKLLEKNLKDESISNMIEAVQMFCQKQNVNSEIIVKSLNDISDFSNTSSRYTKECSAKLESLNELTLSQSKINSNNQFLLEQMVNYSENLEDAIRTNTNELQGIVRQSENERNKLKNYLKALVE